MAAVVVVGATVGVATLVSGGEPADEPSAAPTSAPQNPIGTAVPRVADLEGETAGGDAVFTWTNPDPQDGDVFIWQPVALDGAGSPQRVEDTTVRVPLDAAGRTCIEVSLVRADGRSSPEPTRGCVP